MKKKNSTDKNENVSVENKKIKKEKSLFKKTSKNEKKIEHEKSELAKNLGIRISHPYGYYPEDVDPIIAGLQSELSNLTKENISLSEELVQLKAKHKDLLSLYQKMKMDASVFGLNPSMISLEQSLEGLSKVSDINGGQKDTTPISQLKNMLEEDPISMETKKPSIKLKNKSGGNT